jgi:hypothetical protein
MRPQDFQFSRSQLEGKILGKTVGIAFHCLIERLSRHPIQLGQIRIQNHTLISDNKNQRFQRAMKRQLLFGVHASTHHDLVQRLPNQDSFSLQPVFPHQVPGVLHHLLPVELLTHRHHGESFYSSHPLTFLSLA